jgi:hypothetical protein
MNCKWCTSGDEKNNYNLKYNKIGVTRFKIDGIITHVRKANPIKKQ